MSKYRIVTDLVGGVVVYYVEKKEKIIRARGFFLRSYEEVDVWVPPSSPYNTYEISLEDAEAVVKRLLKKEQFKSEVVGEYDLSYIRQRDADTSQVQA